MFEFRAGSNKAVCQRRPRSEQLVQVHRLPLMCRRVRRHIMAGHLRSKMDSMNENPPLLAPLNLSGGH